MACPYFSRVPRDAGRVTLVDKQNPDSIVYLRPFISLLTRLTTNRFASIACRQRNEYKKTAIVTNGNYFHVSYLNEVCLE